MALDLHECNKACLGCIKRYKDKHTLKTGQKFTIRCNGIPRDHIPLAILNSIKPEEREMAKGLLDPVTWASQTLDWHCLDPDGEIWKRKNPDEYYDWIEKNPGKPILGHSRYHRPYQADMLRCTSKRKVFRIGRQAGKCLASGTMIQMADGTQKPVEEVQDGDLVVSITNDYKSIINQAFRACNGEKEVLKIELMDGREIEATYNHPFLSRKNVGRETTGARRAIFHDEWKPAEELTENDYLAVPRNIELDLSNNTGIPSHAMTVLGCLIADGNITGQNCRFSNENQTIVSHFEDAIQNYKCSLKQYQSDCSEVDYHVVGQGVGRRHLIKDWLRNLGLQGLNSHEKFIPDFVMREGRQNIVELLRCMFGCDGWASVDKNGSVEIGYSTVSEKLANQMVALLARFGIYTTVSHKTVKLNGKKYYSRQLLITRKESILNFRNKIGILGKDDAVEAVYQASQSKNSSPKTEAYEDIDITFIKVRSIKHIGKRMTWDLTVPETHNFIANNIVTHNTESLVISMLFSLFTKPSVPDTEGFKIVIITPYQSQIELIFTRMNELIQSSSITQNSLKRYVKAPMYTMELYNGSVVRGFTAGTKSGGNAEAVRGQHAHMLVFDEADYLNSGDMDAAMAIITNYPTATVWMSSTPSGKREMFYENCNSKRYKEFHFPSSCNPLWNDDLEADFREALTGIGYTHECNAEFGEQEQGVFQNAYIQAAKADYRYGDLPPTPGWTYSIGVDWNDTKIGTTINVLGFDPSRNMFIVVDRTVVSREGWTQLTACEKIVELNRIWHPMAIYVDKGFGGTQIEVLKAEGGRALSDPVRGHNHPDSRLRNIVKPYDFGSSIEVRDYFTKQPVKKNAKGFLVESTVRRFESNDIRFSEYDEALENQLNNYVIDRITPTGNPVYKASNEDIGDHALDALMLSVLAFIMEVTPLGKPVYTSKVLFTGRIGEHNEPDIYQGDLVIVPEKRKSVKDQRDRGRPEPRTMEQRSLFSRENQLPAAHTQHVKPKLWSFNRSDGPPRQESSRRQGLGMTPRKGGRPKRNNI